MKSKKWLISLGLAVVLVVAFALPGASCEPKEPTAPTRLNMGVGVLMDSLAMDQEALQYSNVGCLYLMLVYENLAFYPKIDEDLGDAYNFVPKLATNYSITYESDGTGGQNQVWTIDLREGVKWSDGQDFTADDVVYTLKYVTNKWGVNKPINWKAVVGAILPGDVLAEKTGEHQVTFTFIAGWHQNENFFPSVYMWDAVVPEHVFGPAGNGTYEDWNKDPLEWDGEYIGTGPYKVKEWAPGEYLLLERNNAYWGDLPAAQQVLFTLYADTEMMFIALEAGEIDCTLGDSAPSAKIDDYVDNPDIEVEIVPGLGVYYLGFNLHPDMGYEPLQDLVLRKAIAYAIDKQDIVEMVFGGYGAPADSWVYLESPNHHPSLPNNEYDPTAAENLLLAANYTKKEDGYWYTPEGEKIEFSIGTSGSYLEETAQVVQDLGDFGLDVSVQSLDAATYYKYLYDPPGGGMQAFVSAEDPSPNPWSDWIWMMLANPGTWGIDWNPCWYCNAAYDTLFQQNYFAPNLTAKKAILFGMQQILAGDLPVVFLARKDLIAACRTDNWDNWFNEMGGYATWINEYSIREVTPKT